MARAAFEARQRQQVNGLRAGAVAVCRSRLIRAAANRAGLMPAQVLAQLAERVVVGEDGTVSVPPITLSRRLPAVGLSIPNFPGIAGRHGSAPLQP